MADTYCGKSCESCTYKESLGCPGCKDGPGRSWNNECELAKCCAAKGHENCATCGFQTGCGLLHKQDVMPRLRQEERERLQAQEAEDARRAPFLGKWLWLLFWLFIPSLVASIMTNENVSAAFPALYLPGMVLNILCTLAYGLILLKLGREEDSYHTAGILCLVSVGILIPAAILAESPAAGLAVIVTLAAGVVALVSEYHEYMGHAEILCRVDNELSEKWRTLWKWYIGSFAATIGSVFLILILSIIGLLLTLAAAITLLVVSILKLVYLYRTAQAFRRRA